MRTALFIPCYVNALYPQVGVASYRLLRSLGIDAEYPEGQTCCGQPMANAGFEKDAVGLAARMEELFAGYDYVVTPSASCTAFVRENYGRISPQSGHACLDSRMYDICEFLHDIVRPAELPSTFPHRVSIHNSCHGTRLLGLSSPGETVAPRFSKLRDLLSLVGGIEVTEPDRPDECCGFGGMFSLEEADVSIRMGLDKVARHIATGAEYITGADSSCLMHMNGVIVANRLPIKTIHITEILASGL